MSKQPHAALTRTVQGPGNDPIGSGTLKDNENELLDDCGGISTTPTSSLPRPTSKSASEFKEVKQGASEAKAIDLDSPETQKIILNKFQSSGRSFDGGVDSADIDQPGSANSARMQAQSVSGETELLPGVQAPRECLSPRRQVDKVWSAGGLLADVQGDPLEPNPTDGRDMATGDGRCDGQTGDVSRRGDGPPLTGRMLRKPEGATAIPKGAYTDGLAIDESETQVDEMTVQTQVDGMMSMLVDVMQMTVRETVSAADSCRSAVSCRAAVSCFGICQRRVR